MDWKSAQLKNESKRDPFSAPADAQENANGTAINAFEVRLMMQFRVHLIIHLELYLKVHFKIYIKIHKKVAPENTLKNALQVALESHLLSMHEYTKWFNKRWNWGSTLCCTWRLIQDFISRSTKNYIKSWWPICQCNWECTWGYTKAAPKDALSNLHKDTQEGAFEVAFKVALELPLKSVLEVVVVQKKLSTSFH